MASPYNYSTPAVGIRFASIAHLFVVDSSSKTWPLIKRYGTYIRYLTCLLRSLVEHLKINFIYLRAHVLFSLYIFKRLTITVMDFLKSFQLYVDASFNFVIDYTNL